MKGKTQEAMANIKKKTREEGELACLTRRNQTSYSLKEILFLYNVMLYDMERFLWFCGLGELWKEPLSVTDFSKTWAEVIFRVKWKVFGSLYALHNKFLPLPKRLIRFLCCVLRQFCCCQEKQLPSNCYFFVSICWQLCHAVKEALKDIFRHSNKAEWVKTIYTPP